MAVVDSAGVPIYYEISGNGPPIVLVHGWLSSLQGNWEQTGWIEFLVGRGRSVVALDCRGHGRSGKPHDPAAYEDLRMPGDVLAVIDAAGLAVVGDRDDSYPAAQRLTETVPNAQLVVLPGEDHLSAVSAQAYKDAVAAFL